MPTRYSNPPVPEGINTSERRPLRAFVRQSLAATAVFAALLMLVGFFCGVVAPYIPFAWEQRLLPAEILPAGGSAREAAVAVELQKLADRIAPLLELPEGLRVTMHYSSEDTVNAFATLGGNIVICRGLLERIGHEETLAALLAHEMAHVKHRDVIAGVLRGLGGMLLLAGIDSAGSFFDGVARLSFLGHSRGREDAADEAAGRVVAGLYGSTAGAEELFLVLEETVAGEVDLPARLPEILSSHPDLAARRKRVEELGELLGLPKGRARVPLPAAFKAISNKNSN